MVGAVPPVHMGVSFVALGGPAVRGGALPCGAMALGIDGLAVGCWTHPSHPTGCTVLLPPAGTVGGCAVRGGAPGSRETPALRPEGSVQQCTAIVLTGGSSIMPGMVELGEDIFLKPVRRGLPHYSGALSDMVSQPRAATVMGLLEEARLARLRGFRVAQKNGSVKTAMGRVKDWFVGNF